VAPASSIAQGVNASTGGGLKLNVPSIAASSTAGFSFSSLISSSSQASNLQQTLTQNLSAPLQPSAAGGLFKLDQTPALTQSVTNTTAMSGGPLNFSFGGGAGFKFPSSGPSQQPQQQPAQQLPMFGGATQPTPQPGGIFGATATTSAPTFNFSAPLQQSSTASGGPQPLKLPGGVFGNSAPQPPAPSNPSNPPMFNFGSSTASQSTQLVTNTPFNFSATATQQQQQTAPGGSGLNGSSSIGFNFSGATGKTGNTLDATGSSSTGFNFGVAPPTQAASNVTGFNFSAGSNATSGFNFGKPPSNPNPGTGMFGGSTNQMPAGGIFGQTQTPQKPTSSLFNPSLTAPATLNTTPQPNPGGFNFTPQPSNNAFNFAAGSTGAFGSPAGVFGTPTPASGPLFSAGTPKTGESSSRPVATARRRHDRRRK
jgi:hypothetical protein